MSIVKIKIIDSLGQPYTLPKTFELRSDPSARRSALLDLAFTHGAKDISDGKFAPKYIEVSGKIWAASDDAYNVAWDALAEHLLKEDIRIQVRNRQIYLKRVVSITHDFPNLVAYHFGTVSITFLALDPFWYGTTAQQKQTGVTSSPKDFQHDIGGLVETWPIITIDNNADNTNFTLVNKTDDNRSFQIQDSGATNGTTITIDCKAGTVKRGSSDIIDKFSGLFLRLLGGRTNEFTYTGANCDITIQYFEAWI